MARFVRRIAAISAVIVVGVAVAPSETHSDTLPSLSRKGLRMARLTPEEFGQKWATRTAAATPEYQAGIQRVQTAPGQLAAAKEAKYQAGVQQAVTSGKWRRNVAGVSLQSWQDSALNKGAQRLATGAQAAQAKMSAAGARILPMIDAVKSEVDRMPDNTIEDRIAKSAAFARGMNKRANGSGR